MGATHFGSAVITVRNEVPVVKPTGELTNANARATVKMSPLIYFTSVERFTASNQKELPQFRIVRRHTRTSRNASREKIPRKRRKSRRLDAMHEVGGTQARNFTQEDKSK